MEWNKYLGQYPCYEADSDFRTLDDVAGCLALIPQQLDTPVLKEIRVFLEKYNRKPKYHGSNFEQNDEHIKLKDLLMGKIHAPGKSYEYFNDSEEVLKSIKNRIRWGLKDAPINLVLGCNQKIQWTKIPINETMYREDYGDIIDGVGTPLCHVEKEMLLTADALSDALNKEQWDVHAMTYSLKAQVHQNWIKENAWDFTKDELTSLDIDKELGLKDDKTTG